jgi:hypothetical protein
MARRPPASRRGTLFPVPIPVLSATAPSLPPGLIAPSRSGSRVIRTRRGVLVALVPAGTAPITPASVPAMTTRRRSVTPPARPGRNSGFFATPVHRSFAGTRALVSRRQRLARSRAVRSQFFAVPTTAAGLLGLPLIGRRRLVSLAVRRGQILPVPRVGLALAAASWVAPAITVRRDRTTSTRRARPIATVFIAIAPVVPAAAPFILGCRRPAVRATRRGAFLPAPIVPPTIAVPSAVPTVLTNRRLRLLTIRRGATWVPGAATPSVPPLTTQDRSRCGVFPRRGTMLWVPIVAPASTPSAAPSRLIADLHRKIVPARRGATLWVPVPVIVPPSPGPLAPTVARQARRIIVATRRTAFFRPPGPQSVDPDPPPIPDSPAARRGSWYTLLGVYQEAAELTRDNATTTPTVCPNDGTILDADSHGHLGCRFDGWEPGGELIGEGY